ncbi:putrescine-ornithine antiporter [Acetilactobacillus jinshanensis]|nr:putrescine-ornithine antiporter [Acetilactobacillus jinshanensis]
MHEKKMNVFQLTVVTIINMMGSGIVLLPANLAEVGTISVLSWVITFAGAMALAYAFSKAGLYTTNQDGMGGYAQYAYGKSGAFLANYTYGISLLIADAAIAISVMGYIAVLFNWHLDPLQIALGTIALLWFGTVLNFGGARMTGDLSIFNILGIIVPIVVLSIVGWFYFSSARFIGAWDPHNYSIFKGVSKSIPITLWGFMGLETAPANMNVAKHPKHDVPIAVVCGTIGSAILYVASTNVIMGITPLGKLANSNAPFGLVFSEMFSPIVGKIVMAVMIISCFGSLLDGQCTIADVFKASSYAGYFPKIFRETIRNGSPIIGMFITTGLQTLLALMTISPTLSRQFSILVNLAVVTNVVPYILSMGTLNSMQIIERAPIRKRTFTNAIAFIASMYCLYALYTTGPVALMCGALVTFAGWPLYGLISHRFVNLY